MHPNDTIKRLSRQTEKADWFEGNKGYMWSETGYKTRDLWLQLLRDAEYVVTNSFHATAFSVLFHKKFFTVVHGEKGEAINDISEKES